MFYIFLSLLSGFVSAAISIYFRMLELKTQTIIFGKHIVSQIAFFFASLLLFSEFFSHVVIELPFVTLSWFWIFFLFSSLSYYAGQVFFEYITGKKLFAPKEELEAYLEKIDRERDNF